MSDTIRIVIPLYAGVTQLDFTGPVQFFTRMPDFEVMAASVGGGAIKAEGLTFADLYDLQSIDRTDVLCVPGGACHLAMEDLTFMAEIRRLGLSASYVTSVCTGSLILGAAGLLAGKRAACHWSWREMLSLFDAIPDSRRVVRDGNVITGGGVTAGIDFALSLIAELRGDKAAQAVQLNLEYAPEPPFNAGRPEIAPTEIYATVAAQRAPSMAANLVRVEAVARRVRGLFDGSSNSGYKPA
ncbi:MAG: DJ-1/PfpI family protein [Bradyrhizobium sp.]|nr:DJ-1/PfpI family protein [Bradyrhizobium sp.]